MIDWVGVGCSALWIAGLVLVLAAFSRGHWLAGVRRVQARAVLAAPACQMAFDGGLLLVSVGLLLRSRSAWERVGWSALALLCALLTVLEWRRGRLAQHEATDGPAPAAATPVAPTFVVTTSVVPGRLATWAGRAELWWVLATLPFLLFPGRLAPWAAASLAVLWVVRRITTGHITARTPVDWPLLVLVLMLPVGVWASADLGMTLPALYRLIGGIALFYGVVNWAWSRQRLVASALLFVLIGAALAVLAFFAKTDWSLSKLFNAAPILAWLQAHVRDWIPEEINANVLAGGLALVWPVAAALLFARLGRWRNRAVGLRLVLAGALFCVTGVLLLTQSRGALLAVVVAAAFMAMLRWPPLRLCIPAAVLVLLLWLARGGGGQLQQLADGLSSTGTVTSLSGRQEVWSRAIYMIQDFPYTGIGLGTFDLVQPLLYPFFLTNGPAHHAHNVLLQVAVDLGLPGLIAYLALLLGAFYATWRAWQETRLPEGPRSSAERVEENGFLDSLALGLLGGQAALFVHGMLDTAWANKLAVIPWFLLGLAMAVARSTANGRPAIPSSESSILNPSPIEVDQPQRGGT